MGMGREEITQMNGRVTLRTDFHQLMAPGVAASQTDPDLRTKLMVSLDNLQPTACCQELEIEWPITLLAPRPWQDHILPFVLLDQMSGGGKGKFLLTMLVQHDYTAGVVKITMGQKQQINILAADAQHCQLAEELPGASLQKGLFLDRELIAKTAINQDSQRRSPDEKRIIT